MAVVELDKRQLTYIQKITERGGRKLPKPVPVVVHDNRKLLEEQSESLPTKPPIILFPGLGNHERPIDKILRRFGEQGLYAAVVDVGYHTLFPNEQAVETGWREIPHVVFDELRTETPDAHFNTVGHSGGAGVLGLALDHNPEPFGDIALVQPSNIHKALKSKDESIIRKRRRSFLFRFAVCGLKQPLELETMRIGREVALETIADVWSGRYKANIDTIFNNPIQDALKSHVSRGNSVEIFTGSKDTVFPAFEIIAALATIQESSRPKLTVFKGVEHAALNSRSGRLLMYMAVNSFRPAA